MNGKVYCVTHPETDKSYIGITYDDNINVHFYNYVQNTLCRRLDTPLARVIRECGGAYAYRYFRVSVLEEGITDQATLYDRRHFYVREWKTTTPHGYNWSDGSDLAMPVSSIPIHEGGSFYWDIPCAECGDELYSQFCDYGTEDIYREPEVCAKCEQHARDELSELTHRNYIEQYGERTRNVLPDTLF